MSQCADLAACCLVPRIVLGLPSGAASLPRGVEIAVVRAPCGPFICWPSPPLGQSPLGPRAPELLPVGQLFSRWGPALTLLLSHRAALVTVTGSLRLGRISCLTQESHPSRWLMLCSHSYGQIPLSAPSTPASWGLWRLLSLHPPSGRPCTWPTLNVSQRLCGVPACALGLFTTASVALGGCPDHSLACPASQTPLPGHHVL